MGGVVKIATNRQDRQERLTTPHLALRQAFGSMPDEKARAKNKTARVAPGGLEGHVRL